MKATIFLGTISFFSFLLVLAGCSQTENAGRGDDDDDDTSSGTEDSDTGSMTVVDTGSETDTDTPTIDTDLTPFINPVAWISNSHEGTLSKIDTQATTEVARYEMGPEPFHPVQQVSVNLHGDVAAACFWQGDGTHAVIKIAGVIDDCVDNGGAAGIETSSGPSDILAWGDDECVLWSTPMDVPLPQTTNGFQGIAWDGTTDPWTGAGGNVWFGTCRHIHTTPELLYKLDGETGAILDRWDLPTGFNCVRGAAVDAKRRLWLTNGFYKLLEVNMDTMGMTEHPIECGAGLTVDGDGTIWTAGVGYCIHRFDPDTGIHDTADIEFWDSFFYNSISIGRGLSAGYAWITDSLGYVIKVDPVSLTLVEYYTVYDPNIYGAYPDADGYLWCTHNIGDLALRFDPTTEEVIEVPVGHWPFAYSDFTGAQLLNVFVE